MSDEAKILSFVAFCIERYKFAHHQEGESAAGLFHRLGVDKYLYEEYDVLHTMGEREILDDIARFIAVREEKQ